MLAFFAVFQG